MILDTLRWKSGSRTDGWNGETAKSGNSLRRWKFNFEYFPFDFFSNLKQICKIGVEYFVYEGWEQGANPANKEQSKPGSDWRWRWWKQVNCKLASLEARPFINIMSAEGVKMSLYVGASINNYLSSLLMQYIPILKLSTFPGKGRSRTIINRVTFPQYQVLHLSLLFWGSMKSWKSRMTYFTGPAKLWAA